MGDGTRYPRRVSAAELRPGPTASRIGYVLVALSAVCASGGGVFARLAIDAGVAPEQIAGIRIYGAATILLVAFLPHARKLRRSDLLPMVLFSLSGLVLGQGAYFQAISRVDIAIVLVVVFTAPLVVTAYQRIRHAERLPRYAYGAVLVAIAGVTMAILGSGKPLGSLSIVGLAFALVAMITYVIAVVIAARLPTTLPPLARTGACMLLAALVWLVLAPPWNLPFEALGATAGFSGRFGFALPVWVAMAFVVLIGSVGVYVCWVAGTIRVGAGASSMVGMIEPVLAAIVAWGLLGQSLTPVQSVGIGLTVTCIVIVEHARIRGPGASAPDVPVDL